MSLRFVGNVVIFVVWKIGFYMEKIFSFLSISQHVYERWLLQRLLASILMLLGLTILTAILGAASVILAIYAAHQGLLLSGLTPLFAFIVTIMIAVLVMFLCVMVIRLCIQRLRHLPHTLFKQMPLASSFHAFMQGFMRD